MTIIKKRLEFKKNIISTIVGLLIINIQAIILFSLLKHHFDIQALIYSLVGSFVIFMVLRLSNYFKLINKLLGLGIVCGFIGSFVIALLFNNYNNLNQEFKTTQVIEISKISEIRNWPYHQIFKTHQTKPAFEFIFDYKKINRKEYTNYVVVPILTDFKNDSIFYFAGFKYTNAILSDNKEELLQYIASKDVTIWKYKDTSDLKYLKIAAIESIFKHKLKVTQNPVFLEFIDRKVEIALAWKRFINFGLFINLIWLFFAYIEIKKTNVNVEIDDEH